MRRSLFILFFASLIGPLAHADKLIAGFCQLNSVPSIQNWPFSVQLDSTKPVWSAELTASELQTRQAQYFSGRASPFMRNSVPPELGFYSPGLDLHIEPFLTYHKTVDGRSCAQVVGAKLHLIQKPEILLAKELADRGCVARSALAQQLKHHEATTQVLQSLLAQDQQNEAKKMIFEIYKFQGAAGVTPDQILQQLQDLERQATAPLIALINPAIQQARRQMALTKNGLAALYSSCNGEFGTTASLADPAAGGAEH